MMTIRDLVTGIIRSNPKLLSMEDERRILEEIQSIMRNAASKQSPEAHRIIAAAWEVNPFLEDVSEDLQKAFRYITQAVVDETRPAREGYVEETLNRVTMGLLKSYDLRSGSLAKDEVVAEFRRYAAAICDRGVIRVAEGGQEWRSLEERDLFRLLAPFIWVEAEGQSDPLALDRDPG